MKLFKIIVILIIAIFLSEVAYAGDPVWNFSLISGTNYFYADRDPTVTEPIVNSTLTISVYTVVDFPTQFYWYNNVSHAVFDYVGGANGAMIWVQRGYNPPARIFGYVTPTLNNSTQLSTTRDTSVSYNVQVSLSSLILTAATGTVYLEISDDSGFTTNVAEVGEKSYSISGVAETSILGLGLNGTVPASKYIRIRTQVNSGTVIFTSKPGQEVQL